MSFLGLLKDTRRTKADAEAESRKSSYTMLMTAMNDLSPHDVVMTFRAYAEKRKDISGEALTDLSNFIGRIGHERTEP